MMYSDDANELLKQDEREERAVRALRGYRCFRWHRSEGWVELQPLDYFHWLQIIRDSVGGHTEHVRLLRLPRSFIDRVCGLGAAA